MRAIFSSALGSIALMAMLVSCGSSGSNSDGGATDASSEGTGAAGGGGLGFGGGLMVDGGSGGSGGTFNPDSGCVAQSQRGENILVDMYVMLDISGSMLTTAGGGGTKWDAVRQALVDFVNDGRSSGLGVGIQFFPVFKPGVPATCSTQAECGADGPCTITVCEGSPAVEFCAADGDCGANGPCVPFGRCSGAAPIGCRTTTPADCPAPETCQPFTSGDCAGRTSCNVTDYETPAVSIAELPGNAASLVAAINGQMPVGLTPTFPALSGAINQASAFAQASAGHKVIVVFATDGVPTECSPTDIASIQAVAANAAGASPSIETYVIGVFAPDEMTGRTNADAIASSGGTSTAFIVDPAGNVSQQFLDALDAIRGGTLGCEFQIPDPPAGGMLDFQKVNVRFTEAGNEATVLNVADESQCDPASGGWYYDVSPSNGTPTSIIACPASCDDFTSSVNGQVDIALGCQTIVAPPR